MRNLIMTFTAVILTFSLIGTTADARKGKPWPDISLSTLPSVVGAANSWAYEINHRSPTYLADLDKMYVSLSYGLGKETKHLPKLKETQFEAAYRSYCSVLDNKISNFRFNIYSNLGKHTFGSLWVTYGKRLNRLTNKSIIKSIPSSMEVKIAFAWRIAEKITLGVSGSKSNWPRSLVFIFQPKNTESEQAELRADVGENLVGELDLLYRHRPDLDIIIGGFFQNIYTKSNLVSDNYGDTCRVKEYIYSGAPRFAIKKTFTSGAYLRLGGAYYFNLFDYEYEGGGSGASKMKFEAPSSQLPSYRLQEFSSFTPKWHVFADGSKILGNNSALYLAGEFGHYPNHLTIDDTQWAPLRGSLVELNDLVSGSVTAEITSKLTRILHAMAGVEIRLFDNGDVNDDLDNRSLYAKLSLGTTTRFYRNLWWSVRAPDIRLYTSKALGSSILFRNRSYIETEILFLGL